MLHPRLAQTIIVADFIESMKQQEAVDFIRAEMTKARTVKQISADLSVKLNAPQDVVEKFVKKIVDETVATDFLTSAAIHAPVSPPVVDPATFEALLTAGQAHPEAKVQSSSKPDLPSDAHKPPASRAEAAEPPAAGQPPEFIKSPKYDDPAIESFVLQELGKQQNRDDVVLRLCELTGMSWSEAQNAVARVQARGRKRTTANQKMIVASLSLIALVAGVILSAAALSQAASLLTVVGDLAASTPEQLQHLYGNSHQLFWAFILGIALGIGGLVSLIIAIRKK